MRLLGFFVSIVGIIFYAMGFHALFYGSSGLFENIVDQLVDIIAIGGTPSSAINYSIAVGLFLVGAFFIIGGGSLMPDVNKNVTKLFKTSFIVIIVIPFVVMIYNYVNDVDFDVFNL